MLTAVSGHYDGQEIVLDEKIELQTGQKLMITILDSFVVTPAKKQVELKSFMGRGPKMFTEDAAEYVRELRSNDRV